MQTCIECSDDYVKRSSTTVVPRGIVSIEEFLRRPVSVASFTWSSTAVTSRFPIWNYWKQSAAVAEKLSRYRYCRGKFCVRVVINGNPLSYGMLVVGLVPGPTSHGQVCGVTGMYPNYYSQIVTIPHVKVYAGLSGSYDIYSDLKDTTGWVDLTLTSTSTGGDTFSLVINPNNSLRSKDGGAPPDVNVDFYAWVEDIELSVPVVDAQSAEDRPDGPISGPASVVASVAQSLQPVFGRFATAAEIAAVGVGKIAKLFGFSRPTAVDQMGVALTQFSSSYAATIGSRFFGYKLAGDAQQGVAVTSDAAIVGSDSDMLFDRIVSREGLLGTIAWDTTSPVGTALLDFAVSPYVGKSEVTSVSGIGYVLPPCASVAFAHRYWAGDVVFRIEVIASAFHRGVLRLSWSPTGSAVTVGSDQVVKTQYVEISGVTTTEFVCEYPTAYTFLHATTTPRTTTSSAYDLDETSGVFTITPFVALTCNGVAAAVDINVYVRMNDTAKFARPEIIMQGYRVGNTNDDALPPVVPAQSMTLDDDHAYKVCFGERHVSVNQLCKRFCPYFQFQMLNSSGSTGGPGDLTVQIPPVVISPGTTAWASAPTTMTSAPFTFTSWFEAFFLAQRGGYRYTVVPMTDMHRFYAFVAETQAAPAVGTTIEPRSSYWGSGQAVNAIRYSSGFACFDPTRVSAMEIEVPQVITTNFRHCHYSNSFSSGGALTPKIQLMPVVKDYTTTTSLGFEVHAAAADDYSLHYYVFSPVFIVDT